MSRVRPAGHLGEDPVDKIGMVIGPKGQTINAIQDETGAEISIEDDGTIYVGATNGPSAQAAVDRINAIANPTCRRSATASSARSSRPPPSARSSRCCPDVTACCTSPRWATASGSSEVEDFLNVGDKVEVEIAEIDGRGKIYLDKVRPEGAEPRRRRTGRPAGRPVTGPTVARPATVADRVTRRAPGPRQRQGDGDGGDGWRTSPPQPARAEPSTAMARVPHLDPGR